MADVRTVICTEWQSIESAPKGDGRIIIVGRGGGRLRERYAATARWDETFQRFDPEFGAFRLQPTHWMPLPEPPKSGD